MDGVCPSAYAFSVASRGSACFAALTPDCGHCKSQCSTSSRATPMAHLHTLLRLNRLLPCLRFTAHRHRLITKSSLKASSRHDFVLRLSARKPKCAAETATSFRFVVTHWRFHRTSPCIFRSAQGRFRGFLRRAVGGSWQTASGQSPEPHKRLYNSLFAFSILNKL